MEKIPEKGLVYKTARISYFSNYILAVLIVILFVLILPNINRVFPSFRLTFTLVATNINDLSSTLLILFFLLFLSILIEQPVIERFIRQYYVTNHEVIKVEGIFSKKKISIPYQSVTDIKVVKTFMGRILNYGTVHVRGFAEEDIAIKGIKNPDEVYNIIKHKISLMRRRFGVKREEEE